MGATNSANEPTLAERTAEAPPPAIPGYEIMDLLGRGGMGRVYRAWRIDMGRFVALKVMMHIPDEISSTRFDQEIRAAAGLHHPNIAQIHETGEVAGLAYYTMELVPGGSLAKQLVGRCIEARTAAHLVAKVARGIHHAHERGIVHRDLKPGNIMLDGATPHGVDPIQNETNWIPKIVDFGLAKSMRADADLTRTGQIVGTPNYMAPEQASGVVAQIGPAADIYSLGAVLYECLTGRPPFTGPDPLRTVLMVLTTEPVSPRRLHGGIPADLETICLKCLEKSPQKRYGSAAALADDLERYLNGQPIVARPVGRWERAGKWMRRNPWQTAATALLGLSLVGTVIGLVLLDASANDLSESNKKLIDANNELTRQKRHGDELLALALHDLDQFTFELSDRLYEIPRGEELRRDLLDRARASLEAFDRLRPSDPDVLMFQRDGYDKLADAEMRLGRSQEALQAETKARGLALQLVELFPGNASQRRRLAAINCRVAILHFGRGELAECEKYSQEAEADIEALVREHANDVETLVLKAHLHYNEYRRATTAGDSDRAEAAMRNSLASHRRIAELDPGNVDRTLARVQAETQLATILAGRGKAAEAKVLLEEAENLVLGVNPPTLVAARNARASVHWARGDLLAAQKQASPAAAAYRLALAEFRTLAEEFSKTPRYRLAMAQMLISIGSAWKKAGRAAEGEKDLRAALEILERLNTDGLFNDAGRFLKDWADDLLLEIRGKKEP